MNEPSDSKFHIVSLCIHKITTHITCLGGVEGARWTLSPRVAGSSLAGVKSFSLF